VLQVLPTDYSVDVHQALQYSTAPGTNNIAIALLPCTVVFHHVTE